MHARRSIPSHRAPAFFVISALIVVTLGVNAPGAKADPVCDLFTSDHAINIDFKRPPADIRMQALGVTPIVSEVFKGLPAGTPASVRSFFRALVRLVAQATTVRTTTKSVRQLASLFYALGSSASGRRAAVWIDKQCPTLRDADETPPSIPQSGAATSPPSPAKVPSGLGTSNRPVDPCLLVTRQEAAAALGSDPGPATRPDIMTCEYGPPWPSLAPVARLRVQTPPGGKAAFVSSQTNAADVTDGEFYQTVTGVADSAYEFGAAGFPNAEDGGDVAAVGFLKGSTLVLVAIASPNGTARGSVLTPARIAASRV